MAVLLGVPPGQALAAEGPAGGRDPGSSRAEGAVAPPAGVNQVTLSLTQDFGIDAGRDVCSARGQLEGDYACFRGAGTQYHGTPVYGEGGRVRAAPQPATTRLLAGFDRVFGERFTLGVRLGYVLRGGGPKPDGAEAPAFLPLHGELRAGYAFGVNPFRRAGLRGSLFMSGGVAQVDTEYTLLVREDAGKPTPASQLDNPEAQTLRAYKKTGTAFVGVGGAMGYAISPSLGFSAGLKIMRMFPSSGSVIAPELSCYVGF